MRVVMVYHDDKETNARLSGKASKLKVQMTVP